jgi:hypothetical protein
MYRNIILLVEYWREIRFLTLWEGYLLSVFEKSVLKRIFGHERKELEVGQRKLHNEELNNVYSSTHKVGN